MQDNNNNNQNEINNPQVPQPPHLILQQSQNRSQMNVDQQNQPPVHPPNDNQNQQNQNQMQQLQNIMQLHQQRTTLTSPQSMQGLHTPPTFAHSQPITSPIHFNNNPYGQFPQQHQQPQVLYPIAYPAAFGSPQQPATASTANLNSPNAIINAIAETMDRGLRESANPGTIQGITVGAFIDQLQHLSTNRQRNRRQVSNLADAFQFILWQITTELTAEELDSCRNNNYSIPVSLLGTSVDHTMAENTESKQDQSHQGQMGGNENPGIDIFPIHIPSNRNPAIMKKS